MALKTALGHTIYESNVNEKNVNVLFLLLIFSRFVFRSNSRRKNCHSVDNSVLLRHKHTHIRTITGHTWNDFKFFWFLGFGFENRLKLFWFSGLELVWKIVCGPSLGFEKIVINYGWKRHRFSAWYPVGFKNKRVVENFS